MIRIRLRLLVATVLCVGTLLWLVKKGLDW
jgi:hypothetical protein